MSDDAFMLTGDPATLPATADDRGEARFETANRTQIELQPVDLDAILPPGHAARLVWRFVEGLDLRQFYEAIAAREGGPGRTPIDPKILIALWLYATIDGVGSAREVDRLCYAHDAYRWIRGGVSVNYHTLSDFRVAHAAALDDLLTQSIAALLHRGIVTMARVAHDGTRVRAQAGLGSFRRGATLQDCLRAARKQLERTQRQAEGAATPRAAAAQARAAAEHLTRVEEALAELPAITATKRRNQSKAEPRVSTTDPDARVMKMADGGFRPAYNMQFVTDVDSRVVLGVAATNAGSDQQQLTPMLDQLERRTGRLPGDLVVDGGYVSHEAIDLATRRGVRVLAPVPPPPSGRPPHTPGRADTMAVALWRARMTTEEAKTVYRTRGAIAEWVHADMRTHRTLTQLTVRGLHKVHAWALWAALAHNMLRAVGIVPHLMM
jgi:transposase